MTQNLRAVIFALLAFALFSSHDVVIKILGATYSPFQVVFFSVLLGFPLVTFMLLRDQTVGTLIPAHPYWSALRTLLVVIGGACAFYAFATLSLAQTYSILFAVPLLVTLFSVPLLGERVGIHRGLAVVVGLVGVFIVLQPGETPLTFAHLAALIAALCSALASVIVRKIGRDERTVVLILYPMMANFILMGALMPFFYHPPALQDMGLNLIIAAFALIAMSLMIAAYKAGEAAIVAPMQYSQLIWATLFGSILFGETIGITTWVGAAIIIASGLYIVLREARGGKSNTTPVLRTRSRFATPSAPRVSTLLPLKHKPKLDSTK